MSASGANRKPVRRQPPLLTLKGVTARIRDRRILADTSWTIRAGQSWAVLGPNGAGKSTLAGLLLGKVPYVTGRVFRHRPDALPDRIGHVSFELLEKMAAREIRRQEARQFSGRIDSVTTVRDVIREEAETASPPACWTDEAAERLGLGRLLDRDFSRLSSGELRRVLIARALLKRPGMLVFDEPFEGLDTGSQEWLKETISEMIRQGQTVVLVTHRIWSLVPEISHALFVRDGRVVEKGARTRVLTKPRLARLFSSAAPESPPPRPRNPAPTPGKTGPGADPLVEMRGVKVSYGSKAVLENIDWTVRPGEHWAVLGPNGAGKTTLLSMIAGDHPQAYANEIFLFGRRRGTGESVWDIKRRISLVSSELQIRYQKPVSALDAVLSGFSDSVGLYRRVSDRERSVAEGWLAFVGLAGRAKERFDRLSYGERRRILLARCLVKTPELLILDEPCQGLDPGMRSRFLALIDRIGSLRSPSILYVTHDEDEIPACIDRVLRLSPLAGPKPIPAGGAQARPPAGSCKNR